MPKPGLPHDDRHPLQRNLTQAEPVRKKKTSQVSNDDDKQAGAMRSRKEIKSTTKNITVLRQEQRRQDVHIPKNERARHKPFNEASRARLAQPKLEHPLVAHFFLIVPTTMVATRTPRHSGDISVGRKSDDCGEDRTPRRTHIVSRALAHRSSHAPACGYVLHLCAS